jgi:hypothetical protein
MVLITETSFSFETDVILDETYYTIRYNIMQVIFLSELFHCGRLRGPESSRGSTARTPWFP